MMMLDNKVLILLLMFSFINVSCQKFKITDHREVNNIKNVLAEQLKKGISGVVDESFDIETYNYSQLDLNAIIQIEDFFLKKNGYKPLSDENFKTKINEIFGFNVTQDTTKTYIISSFEKCNTRKEYYRNDNSIQIRPNIDFIILSKKFITELYAIPEIINYNEVFPDLASFENSNPEYLLNKNQSKIKIFKWNEIENLSQKRQFNQELLVNRNLYLFNDDKEKLKWLTKNDKIFMKSLVLTHGLTNDKLLLKWVIENTKFKKNNFKEFGALFFSRQCNGNIKIHSNTFKYFQTTINKDNTKWLKHINSYINYIVDFDNKIDYLTLNERLKILSNLAYFSEQYKYDKRFNTKVSIAYNNKTFGTLRYFISEHLQTIKENNYYNLPKFAKWWKNADYDEYFISGKHNGVWGSCIRPLGYKEWIENGRKLDSYKDICNKNEN